MFKYSSSKLAVNGISVALIILCLYAGMVFPNNKLFFIGCAGLIGGIPYLVGGIKSGVMAYIASDILALALMPNKFYSIAYVILGIYPLVKLLCENKKIISEFIYKFLWLNITLTMCFIIFREFINIEAIDQSIFIKIALIILLNIGFIVYDYVFTKFIMLVEHRIISKL